VPKFVFKLQKVLEYRERLEQEAKDAYMEARAKTIEAEAELAGMIEHRKAVIRQPLSSLEDHRALDLYVQACEDKERQQHLVIQVCEAEEEEKRLLWIEAKKDYQAIVKLRDKAFGEWLAEESRREQNALDEWAVLRRSA
jgi:flagellar FliJ protein